jgi:hypothetical protein
LFAGPDLIRQDVDSFWKIAQGCIMHRMFEIVGPCDVNQAYLINPYSAIRIVVASQILKPDCSENASSGICMSVQFFRKALEADHSGKKLLPLLLETSTRKASSLRKYLALKANLVSCPGRKELVDVR